MTRILNCIECNKKIANFYASRCVRCSNKRNMSNPDVRLKLSIANKGKQNTLGHKLTEEHKRKISNGNKGKKKPPRTEEHTRKQRESHIGKKASLETRKKISLALKGERGGGWRGGVTPINASIRHSLEYKLWRTAVFERDQYTCVWCGLTSGLGKAVVLNADHIKPFADYPELRFAIDNGRTLCVECHRTTDNYGGRYKKLIN
jgi:hypothetical protein